MKNKLFTIVFSLLIIPHAVLASPLSDPQARSLIAVVQSSPETPASAFTDLITAFSKITVKQAESLIAVVQAAPGVAPDAFVSMLIAFTEDTQIDKVQVLENRVTVIEQQVNTPSVGGIIETPMEASKPSQLLVTFNGGSSKNPDAGFPLGSFNWRVSVLDQYGAYLQGQNVSADLPDDARIPWNELLSREEDKLTNPNLHKVTDAQSGFKTKDWGTSFEYIPTTSGAKTITFTSGGLTEIVEVTVD